MSDLIGGYERHLRAAGYSQRTIRARATVLRAVAAVLPDGLDHPAVDELEHWLGNDSWSRWTRYTYFEHLTGFYRWATARGHLSWSPTDRMTRPRPPRCEPRPASEAQLARALGLPPPWRIAVVLAAFDGLRCAEIAGLCREDITRDTIAVRRKGHLAQLLPTHARVWAEVADAPPGPVVRTRTGRPFTPSYLSAAVSRELSRIGLPDLTLHAFRHRFATRALLPEDQGGAGADVRTVQDLLGHASITSTAGYLQVTSRQRRATIARLPEPVG